MNSLKTETKLILLWKNASGIEIMDKTFKTVVDTLEECGKLS